jgi:hypothetical protein
MQVTYRYAALCLVAAVALSTSVFAPAHAAPATEAAPVAKAVPLDLAALEASATPAPSAKREVSLDDFSDLHFVNFDIKLSAPAQPVATPAPAPVQAVTKHTAARAPANISNRTSSASMVVGLTILPAPEAVATAVVSGAVGGTATAVGAAIAAAVAKGNPQASASVK